MFANYFYDIGRFDVQKSPKKQLRKKCKYERTMITIPEAPAIELTKTD